MRIEFFPYPFLLGLSLLLLILPLAYLRSRSITHLAFVGIFWLYLLLLAGVTLFPMPIPLDMGGDFPRQPLAAILDRINLVPFRNAVPNFLSYRRIAFELVGNVLLTMPFGFGLHFIAQVRARHYLWMAFALGLGIESTQLFMSLLLGLGYRGVDITDVILNAVGVLVGYALFRLFAWLLVTLVRLLRIQPKGMFRYMVRVARWPRSG